MASVNHLIYDMTLLHHRTPDYRARHHDAVLDYMSMDNGMRDTDAIMLDTAPNYSVGHYRTLLYNMRLCGAVAFIGCAADDTATRPMAVFTQGLGSLKHCYRH
jgi:hypothetical protein